MKTAFMLFMQKSFKAVTLREIIRESGFSNGAFYHYFNTKEELFSAVANHYWFEFINFPSSANEKMSLKELIQFSLEHSENVLDTIEKEFSAEGKSANFYSFVFEAYRIIPDFKEKMLHAQKKESSLWVEVIKKSKITNEIKSDLPDETIAKCFLNISYGNALTWLVNQDIQNVKSTFRSMWEGIYSMLKA